MTPSQMIGKIKEVLNSNANQNSQVFTIRNIVNNRKPTKIARYTLEEISQQINELCGLTIEEISQRNRQTEIIIYRQMAHYKAIRFTFQSYEDIGAYFGGLTHATLVNSRRKIQNLLETDKRFREQYETFLNN